MESVLASEKQMAHPILVYLKPIMETVEIDAEKVHPMQGLCITNNQNTIKIIKK